MHVQPDSPSRLTAILLGILISAAIPGSAAAQAPAPAPTPTPTSESSAAPSPDPNAPKDPGLSVTEAVTVLATGSPEEVRDTPTPVTVIDAQQITQRLMNDTRDLVRWVPGVYVDNSVTRLGLNGFNIRGIGGNRVQTQIDGVRTAEQFDFGPISVNQYSLDLEALQNAEIVRSAGSALYGSDALGGVVNFTTRDPQDYLNLSGGNAHLGLRAGYDGRAREFGEAVSTAFGSGPWQASAFYARRDGEEIRNRGSVDTEDFTRTLPNPQERSANNVLGKVVFLAAASNQIKLTGEYFDARTRTDVLTGQGTTVAGPTTTTVSNSLAVDDRSRWRLSLEEDWMVSSAVLDRVLWRVAYTNDETLQDTVEDRLAQSPSGTTSRERSGTVLFEEQTVSGDARFQKTLGPATFSNLVTLGVAFSRENFDMLRDRVDVDIASGNVVPSFPLIFPTKYFPKSVVTNFGVYVQDEITALDGALTFLPGVRFDRYELDPDENDAIYLSGNEGIDPPTPMTDSAVSPRVGVVYRLSEPLSAYAQFAQGFRAPAYSYVNNGFTNLASGYTTIPNPNLEPEHSNNYELGLRGSFRRVDFSVGGFYNEYRDFIEIAARGVNPTTGLLEFQAQNVTSASIKGVEVAGTVLIGGPWSASVAYAYIDGDNAETDQPINSIPPNRLVTGVRWMPGSGAVGAELSATFVAAKTDVDTTVVPQFAAPAYQLLDLTAFYNFTENLSVQVGVFNLLNEKYWAWSDVQGISGTSPVLDRYSGAGTTASAALRWRL